MAKGTKAAAKAKKATARGGKPIPLIHPPGTTKPGKYGLKNALLATALDSSNATTDSLHSGVNEPSCGQEAMIDDAAQELGGRSTADTADLTLEGLDFEAENSVASQARLTYEELEVRISNISQELSIARRNLAASRSEELEKLRNELAEERSLRINSQTQTSQVLEELHLTREDNNVIEKQTEKATSNLTRCRARLEKIQDRDTAAERRLKVQIMKTEPLEKENNTLTMQNKKLRAGNEEEVVYYRQRAYELESEVERKEYSRWYLEEHRNELRNHLTQKDRSNRASTEAYQSLGAVYDISRESVRHLEGQVGSLNTEIQSLQKQISTKKRNLEVQQEDNLYKDRIIKSLKSEIVELKRDRDAKEPLVKIGVNIRLGNLEQARETALDVPQGDLDRAIILNGNVAAHRARGAIDAALFEAGLVPEDYIDEARRVFKNLYQVPPENHRNWTSKVQTLVDCQATLKTLKLVGRGQHAEDLRIEQGEIESRLIKLCNSTPGEEFESDSRVEGLMAQLERLTEQIVDIERGRRCRRSKLVFGDADVIGFKGDDWDE